MDGEARWAYSWTDALSPYGSRFRRRHPCRGCFLLKVGVYYLDFFANFGNARIDDFSLFGRLSVVLPSLPGYLTGSFYLRAVGYGCVRELTQGSVTSPAFCISPGVPRGRFLLAPPCSSSSPLLFLLPLPLLWLSSAPGGHLRDSERRNGRPPDFIICFFYCFLLLSTAFYCILLLSTAFYCFLLLFLLLRLLLLSSPVVFYLCIEFSHLWVLLYIALCSLYFLQFDLYVCGIC